MQKNDFTTLLPPHDLDSERCVLASMMLCGDDKQVFELTAEKLRAESFYDPDHGIIFDAILRLHRAQKKIDAIVLRAEMQRAKLYDEVGGDSNIAKILNSCPSYAHGPQYASIIREKYALREIIRVANNALKRVMNASYEEKAADIARQFVNELAEVICTGDADEIKRLSDAVAEVIVSSRSEKVRRYPTGLFELDDIIGGVARGKFTQIGGRPGMGKSMACKQIVLNVAERGIPCGIVSIEETREKIAQNYLANLSGIENNKIAYNNLAEEDFAELMKAVPDIESLPIFISDYPSRISEVEAAITSMVMRHKCELVVVDYLQLISPDEASDNENREITKISKSLKNTFKRLDVAGLVPVQLNRGNETGGVRKPTLRDLRGSGSLEQDGDCIILLHREDYYHRGEHGYHQTNQIEAIVAKNKDGCTGNVPLLFSAATQKISDWVEPQQGDRTEGMFVP